MPDVVELLDLWLDPVGRALNAEAADRLLGLRADARTQQRVEELADRNTEGLLTADERAEYEALVTAADVIAILQAKARARLAARVRRRREPMPADPGRPPRIGSVSGAGDQCEYCAACRKRRGRSLPSR